MWNYSFKIQDYSKSASTIQYKLAKCTKTVVLLVYLNGKAWMHILTCSQTVHASPKSSTASALRSKSDVMVNELAPLHQQV